MSTIEFKGVDRDGDHVFAIPPTSVHLFDECGGTKAHAVWAFVGPSGLIACEGEWYAPAIVYANPEIGTDLCEMTRRVHDWIIECEELYG